MKKGVWPLGLGHRAVGAGVGWGGVGGVGAAVVGFEGRPGGDDEGAGQGRA